MLLRSVALEIVYSKGRSDRKDKCYMRAKARASVDRHWGMNTCSHVRTKIVASVSAAKGPSPTRCAYGVWFRRQCHAEGSIETF